MFEGRGISDTSHGIGTCFYTYVASFCVTILTYYNMLFEMQCRHMVSDCCEVDCMAAGMTVCKYVYLAKYGRWLGVELSWREDCESFC